MIRTYITMNNYSGNFDLPTVPPVGAQLDVWFRQDGSRTLRQAIVREVVYGIRQAGDDLPEKYGDLTVDIMCDEIIK